MKKINDWVIKTFGLRGSWSWAKKQMLNGAIIKREATTGTYKIAIGGMTYAILYLEVL